MNRLTFVDEDGNVLFGVNGADADEGYIIFQLAEEGMADELEEIANRLANAEQRLEYYEDLEEQGRLIELPCLPNEEVWESNKRFGTHKTMYASREAIVGAIEAGYVIGYTKEEAEEKLAEMEGEE